MATDFEKKYPSKAIVMLAGTILIIFALFAPYVMIQLINSDRLPEIQSPMPTEIKSINWDENKHQIKVIVTNNKNYTVTLGKVYANETLDSEAVMGTQVLAPFQSTEIILSQKYATKPFRISVRITTSTQFDVHNTKVFYEINLNQVDWDEKSGKITVAVKNAGDETVTLKEIYVDGARDVSALSNPLILETKQETTISLTGTFMDTHSPISIKVMTQEGISAQSSNAIYGLWIQSINWNSKTGKIIAYVYENGYEGKGEGEVAYVYVNGTLDSSATINDGKGVWNITLSATYPEKPQQITLKVATSEGAFGEFTMSPPNEYSYE